MLDDDDSQPATHHPVAQNTGSEALSPCRLGGGRGGEMALMFMEAFILLLLTLAVLALGFMRFLVRYLISLYSARIRAHLERRGR